jgi:hypothetical protein
LCPDHPLKDFPDLVFTVIPDQYHEDDRDYHRACSSLRSIGLEITGDANITIKALQGHFGSKSASTAHTYARHKSDDELKRCLVLGRAILESDIEFSNGESHCEQARECLSDSHTGYSKKF